MWYTGVIPNIICIGEAIVSAHIYSPDIPIRSADYTIYTPDMPMRLANCAIYIPGVETHSFTVTSENVLCAIKGFYVNDNWVFMHIYEGQQKWSKMFHGRINIWHATITRRWDVLLLLYC